MAVFVSLMVAILLLNPSVAHGAFQFQLLPAGSAPQEEAMRVEVQKTKEVDTPKVRAVSIAPTPKSTSLTQEQVRAVVALLVAFNVDTASIDAVEKALRAQ